MTYIFAALVVSFLVTLFVIRIHLARAKTRGHVAERRRAEWVRESSLHGLGRAGGIGIAAGLLVSLLARLVDDAPLAPSTTRMGLMLLASAAPVFAAGLVEGFTPRRGVSGLLLP